MTSTRVVAGVALLALLGGFVYTQQPSPDKKKDRPAEKPAAVKPAAAKPSAHKVERKPFKIELTEKGILEPAEAAEVAYRPVPSVNPSPNQGQLTIRRIAAHGSTVAKGDPLVSFDTRKLDETIRDAEAELKSADAGIKLAEEELPLAEKAAPAELAEAERAHKRAAEDLKYFVEVGRPQAEKEADFSLKSAGFFLEYAREELQQLEKMYKANDLTEETEQIVLRRQRHMVELATFYFRAAEIDHKYTLQVTLPRRDKDLREGLVKQTQQLDKVRKTQGPQLAQKREALAKMRHDRDKTAARLVLLGKEREGMTVRAPFDGVVYHGKFHRGQWSLSSGQEDKLAPDGTVSPNEVFLTVVKARPLTVRLLVEEKDVHLVKPGLAGKVKVLYDPDRRLPAKVTFVSPLPVEPGKYEVLLALDPGQGGAALMPGMACSVHFVPYSRKDALTVPSGAVAEEDDRHFVTVLGKGGKREKREVTTGRTSGGQTEVLSGLREGEEVLLDAAEKTVPKGDKS